MMSILKNLAKNLGLTNITQTKKKYATVGEKKIWWRKRCKYKVKAFDNLKEDKLQNVLVVGCYLEIRNKGTWKHVQTVIITLIWVQEKE